MTDDHLGLFLEALCPLYRVPVAVVQTLPLFSQ